MAKRLTTRKDILSRFTVLDLGYSVATQLLLRDREPDYYTAGSFGWNCDIYIVGDIALTVGYRPFGTRVSEDIIKAYYLESMREIFMEHVDTLILKIVKEVVG